MTAARDVASQYKKGNHKPHYGGVIFEHAAALGCCQQNVRELVEAVAFGKERTWPEASCCAGSTCERLKKSNYERIARIEDAQPGDLIYMGGGGYHTGPGQCGGRVGHVGVYMGDGELWQNTSYDKRGLCIIPIRPEQYTRITGIFRLFPLATEPEAQDAELRINWYGEYLDPEAVLFLNGRHYVSIRDAALAEGAAVKVDAATGKVFVGPKAWWEKKGA